MKAKRMISIQEAAEGSKENYPRSILSSNAYIAQSLGYVYNATRGNA
jgi:hypothetical protein